MSKIASELKRDLARLRGDAATLHRLYASDSTFMLELSGLARSVLHRAGAEDDAWVRMEIDALFHRYGQSCPLSLGNEDSPRVP